MDTATLHQALEADPAAATAFTLLTDAGGRVYVVGGAVRDAALGKPAKDTDLMVTGLDGDAIEAALYGSGRLDLTGKQFGVYRFKTAGSEVEIAMPRVEYGDTNSEFSVSKGIPVEDDLSRRDFTVNAMAFDPLTGEVIDPHGGLKHINDRTLTAVNPNAFKDDPTRLLRAITAISKHELVPDDETLDRMRDEASALSTQPPERLQMELDKLLSGSNPSAALQVAADIGLLKYILPEVQSAMGFDQQNPHHDLDVGAHLLKALEAMSRLSNDPDLRLAALIHDIGKPDSFWHDPDAPEGGGGHFYKKVNDDGTSQGENHDELGAQYADSLMRRLRYPNDRRERVVFLVRNHMFPYFTNAKGARKFLALCGGDVKTAWDLLLVREADASGKSTGAMKDKDAELIAKDRELIQEVVESAQATTTKDLAIGGHDLMELGIPQGPQLGQILRELTDYVIENPELNSRETLLDLAQQFV
jgi:tRNA nucleotidyltransferase (CCA-adding enzyme)